MEQVRLGLVGLGSFGEGCLDQTMVTPDVTAVAVADLDRDRAERVVREHTRGGAEPATIFVTALDVARHPDVDVYLDGSNAVGDAIEPVEAALAGGKHVVMANTEADLMFGGWFARLARRHDVTYTGCDGDQPVVLARLARELTDYGFRVVMAGNVKGFLDRSATPESIVPEAAKRGLDPQVCAYYTDGSKLAVEMALVANGLGMRLVEPGMRGPRADRAIDVLDHFDFDAILESGTPVVDYVLGAQPRGGVFVVAHVECAYQRRMLDWFPSEHGPGPFYVFTRPYHLVHFESLRTVREIAQGISQLAPVMGRRTEVVCHAKTDLPAGTVLDGPGGFAAYGLIESDVRTRLPICLSAGVRLTRPVGRHERISWDDVDLDSIEPRVLDAYARAHDALDAEEIA